MVRERRRLARPVVPRTFAVLTLGAVLIALGGRGSAGAADEPVRLTDAAQAGTFNVGAAHVELSPAFDPELGGNVSRLRFQVPGGTAAGVWAKGFPAKLSAGDVDLVRLGAKLANVRQTGLIELALEIKGTAGTRRVPLDPGVNWSFREEHLNWPAIGKVNEVVLIVTRQGNGEPLSGSVDVDVRFDRLTWLRWLGMQPVGRIAGVLVLGCVGAFFLSLVRRGVAIVGEGRTASRDRIRRVEAGPGAGFVEGRGWSSSPRWRSAFMSSASGPLEVGWAAWGWRSPGAAMAEWWKCGLTGMHLTPTRSFRTWSRPACSRPRPAGWRSCKRRPPGRSSSC